MTGTDRCKSMVVVSLLHGQKISLGTDKKSSFLKVVWLPFKCPTSFSTAPCLSKQGLLLVRTGRTTGAPAAVRQGWRAGLQTGSGWHYYCSGGLPQQQALRTLRHKPAAMSHFLHVPSGVDVRHFYRLIGMPEDSKATGKSKCVGHEILFCSRRILHRRHRTV
eukprot:1161944-Pelagomonas_calceolata.AAC.18